VAGTSITSRQLGHRQELVDAHGRRLFRGATLALRLHADTAGRLLATMTALLAARLQLRHDARDVLLHRVLVDPPLLLLLLVLLAAAPPALLPAPLDGVGRPRPGGRRREALGLDANLAARRGTRGR
jgi:hypothetical protein